MTDAIYDTPISRDVKVGVKIRGLTIDFPSKIILIDYAEVDADGNIAQRHIANIRIPDEDPEETLRKFLSSLIKENAGPVAKTKRRMIQYMIDNGVISASTIQIGGDPVPPVDPPPVVP